MKNIAPKLSALKLKPEVFVLPFGALDHVEEGVLAEIIENQLKIKLGTENPFKVTSNYFESFEDSIIESIENQSSNSLKVSLKVPDHYFESFEQKVMSKIKNETVENKVKVISLRSRLIKITTTVAVAASLALFFIFNPFQQKSTELSFDSLALTEIEKWIDQDYLELDAYQISSVYSETKLKPNLLSSTVNEDELEEFLNNQNIEELLYEE